MNISIYSSELNRMMKTITQCLDHVADRANIEIAHVDNELTIRSTNGLVSATMSTPLLGGDEEKFCVDGAMFAKVCAMCNGEIRIETDGRNCFIRGAGRTRLPIVQAKVPEQTPVDGKATTITAEQFCKGYSGVSYAVSTDQTRVILTGVLCEFGEYGVKMVALDGFQMSVETAQCKGEIMKAVIPGSFMKLIAQSVCSLEEITIRIDGNRVEAVTEGMRLTSGLLTGEYPDYQRILPKEFKTDCLIGVEALRNALKSGSVINSKQNLIKLEIGENDIRIMNNGEEADYEAEIGCVRQGDGLTIAFNLKYLLNTIGAIAGEEAVMQFNGALSPCIVKAKDEPGVRLVLPCRVAGENT